MDDLITALCTVSDSFSPIEMASIEAALDPIKDGPRVENAKDKQALAAYFKLVLGRSQQPSLPFDITEETVWRNYEDIGELPRLEDLKAYLLKPPVHPFPLSPEAFELVHGYYSQGMFSRGSSGRYCVRLSRHLIHVLEDAPKHGPGEFAFIPLWNFVLHETLAIFMQKAFQFDRNTNYEAYTLNQLPDYVGYIGELFALWRGEEKGVDTEGNPRQELIDKLVWVYQVIPYVMAYHARGTHVTITALYSRSAVVGASDLVSLNLENPGDMVWTFLLMFNLSRILSLLADLCSIAHETSDIRPVPSTLGSEKEVTLSGYKVLKEYRSFDDAIKVWDIYAKLKGVPNAENCQSERPKKRNRDGGPVLVMVPRCSQVVRVRPTGMLVKALVHVCNALQHADTELKLMHRDVTWRNVGLDESCGQFILFDWDEAAHTPCEQAHLLGAEAHAPEMRLGRHTSAVDVWGIGHLILSATGVEKPAVLESLATDCLQDDPGSRPSISECAARLKGIQEALLTS